MLYTISSGKLKLDTVPYQLSTIYGLLKNNEKVEVNLENITDIDSAGIAMLIELRNFADTNGSKISFIHPSADVMRLCQLYRINI